MIRTNILSFVFRFKRALLNRLNLRKAWQCAVQTDRKTVKFVGIANIRGFTAFYASLEHFRHNIPAILPRQRYDFLVSQNFMHHEFIAEPGPKVYFSREPMECLTDETLKNLTRIKIAPFIVSFDERDIEKRMFYVALPTRKNRVLKKLKRSLNRDRYRLCCIVNRYNENDRLGLLAERLRFVRAMGDDIDIFGLAPHNQPNGWDEFPNYQGATRDKLGTLARYNFNLCFENSDADGHITEKIDKATLFL